MKFTYYALFSLIFLLAVFVGAAALGMREYGLEMEAAIRVALWVSAPVAVFVVCAGLMLFYKKMREILLAKKIEKDFTRLADEIYAKALAPATPESLVLDSKENKSLESNHGRASATKPSEPARFYHSGSQEIAKILSRFWLTPVLGSLDSGNMKIDKLLDLYGQIAQGAPQDPRDLRKLDVSPKNPFALQNQKNHIQKSPKHALEALCDKSLDSALRSFAFGVICENGRDKDLQKALNSGCCECVDIATLQRALLQCVREKIALESTLIAQLCKQVHFAPSDYLALAHALQGALSPDEWLAYFEKLAGADESAQSAYLFVLIELEMIEKAEQELKSFRADEMLGVRAYLELKRLGKPYPLHAFSI